MRTCMVCAHMKEEPLLRNFPTSVKHVVILFACLLAFCQGDLETLHSLYQTGGYSRKKVCQAHFAEAAATMIFELNTYGVALMREESGEGFYVRAADIPDQLMNYLLMCERRITNVDSCLTKRDVSVFIYNALHEYYEDNRWKFTSEQRLEDLARVAQERRGISINPSKRPKVEPESTSAQEFDFEIELEAETDASLYTPGLDTISSLCDDDVALPETDPALLTKYVLVEVEQLLKLFKFCPQCGCELPQERPARLTVNGTAPLVHYICKKCSFRGHPSRWEGQKRAISHTKERMFRGNVIAAASAITTGLRFTELQRWAEQSQVAMISRSFFYKVFEWTKGAITTVYERHRASVLEKIKDVNEDGAIDLAADGSYDSRGYSALIGKVVLTDQRTNLVLDTEVLHRTETEGVSGRMEVEGTRRLLRWAVGCGFRLRSLTTDRSYALNAMVDRLSDELGPLTHYYDGWHLVKWLGNELRKAAKSRGCKNIAYWIERVKTHLWRCIEVGAGSGETTRHLFNTCLYHVRGVHHWTMADETGSYTSCAHAPLEGPSGHELDERGPSFKMFEKVVLSKRFQKDLEKVGPYGGTSHCETKHALDRIYCRKEVFYPMSTYPLYAKMATMHYNTLRLAELTGERTVQRVVRTKRKYLTRESTVKIKTPVRHTWRDEVLEELLAHRNRLLESNVQEDPDSLSLPEEVLCAPEIEEAVDAFRDEDSDQDLELDSDYSDLL